MIIICTNDHNVRSQSTVTTMNLRRLLSCALTTLLYLDLAASFDGKQRGSVVLYNNCWFPLYVEGVARSTYFDTEIRPQRTFSDQFRPTQDRIGNSLKVSTKWRSSKVTQIEYSACFGNESNPDCGPLDMIYYDLSKINDTSNAEYSVRVEPSLSWCPKIDCPKQVYRCESTYYQPNDNFATKACDVQTDLKVTFC